MYSTYDQPRRDPQHRSRRQHALSLSLSLSRSLSLSPLQHGQGSVTCVQPPARFRAPGNYVRRRQCVPRGSNHRPSPQNPVTLNPNPPRRLSRKPPYCRHCSSSVARAQAVLAPPSGHVGSQTVHTLHKFHHLQHSTHAPSCNEQERRTCSTEGPACKFTHACATVLLPA